MVLKKPKILNTYTMEFSEMNTEQMARHLKFMCQNETSVVEIMQILTEWRKGFINKDRCKHGNIGDYCRDCGYDPTGNYH